MQIESNINITLAWENIWQVVGNQWKWKVREWNVFSFQFSVPQIEYPLGVSSKNGSHVHFLLQIFCVILLFCQIVLLFDINVVLILP